MSAGRSRRPGLVAALSTTGLVLIATGGIALVVITGNDVVTGGSISAAPTAPGQVVRKDVPTITQPRPATATRDPGAGRTTASGGRPTGTVPAGSGSTGALAPAGGAGADGSQASAPFSGTGGLAALTGVTGAARTGSTAVTVLATGTVATGTVATGTVATGTVATGTVAPGTVSGGVMAARPRSGGGLSPAISGTPTAPQVTLGGASAGPLLGPPIPPPPNPPPPRVGGGVMRASAGTGLARLMVALGGSGLTTPAQTSALRFLLLDAQLPAFGTLSKVLDPPTAAGGGVLDAHDSKALAQAVKNVCGRVSCDPLESLLPWLAEQSVFEGPPPAAPSQQAAASESSRSAPLARTPAPTGPPAPTAAASPTQASRANPPAPGGADVRSEPAGPGAKAGKEASDSKRGHDGDDNARTEGKHGSWRQLPQEDRNNDD